MNIVYRIANPESDEHHFTEKKDQAEIAQKHGYDVSEYIIADPVYQERRFQFIGKRQFEYWADIDRSTYQYLPESERRIIYINPGETGR
ncbi:hypothetical protein [Atlantibacter hermannii]|uniref:hypothetical protein n=1 Tax=Atlantibacter hermannii TaxID=565 RepID=UPI002FE2ECE1